MNFSLQAWMLGWRCHFGLFYHPVAWFWTSCLMVIGRLCRSFSSDGIAGKFFCWKASLCLGFVFLLRWSNSGFSGSCLGSVCLFLCLHWLGVSFRLIRWGCHVLLARRHILHWLASTTVAHKSIKMQFWRNLLFFGLFMKDFELLKVGVIDGHFSCLFNCHHWFGC